MLFLNQKPAYRNKLKFFISKLLSLTITMYNTRAKISVMGNFMKRLCACLISMAISIDQISFETKQKSKCKVYFNLIFISIEKNILEIY